MLLLSTVTSTNLSSPGLFERIDIWDIQNDVDLDDFSLEVLQPAPHPGRPNFGRVHELSVTWESEIEAVRLHGKTNVSRDPVYRNYHGHASHSWKINGQNIGLETGRYTTTLGLQW